MSFDIMAIGPFNERIRADFIGSGNYDDQQPGKTMSKLCGRPLVFGDKEQIEQFKKQGAEAPFCPKCGTLSNEFWDWDSGEYFECPRCWCMWWIKKGKIIIDE